jgi:Ricin-type beta-trefoil lectin domain-like/Secretion system C-terminal sorting domain/Glycosyl hydrolases family 16
MKQIIKKVLLTLVLWNFIPFLNAQPTAPNGKKWVAVPELNDEFNGNSLDFSKWLDYHPYWSGRNSVFTKANVSVTGGNLKLFLNKPGNTALAACVTSKNKSMKKGMYSEARVKCPSLSATGAFWFQGNYSEIDVIENFGQPTGNGMYNNRYNMKTNLHYFPNGWPNDQKTQYDYVGVNPAVDDAYHTYGIWWKDSRTIIFYLNGREIHTSIAKGDFNEDMYMFFDMEIFDWGIGFPTEASLDNPAKNAQYVDWVHTYRLENSNGGGGQLIPNGNYYLTATTSTQRILSRALEQHNAKMVNPGNYDDQKWLFTHLGDNVYTIKNLGTNRFLEVVGTRCGNAEIVSTNTQASGNNQKWKIEANGNAIYSIKPMHCIQVALDRAGGAIDAKVQTWNFWKDNDNQKWKIVSVNTSAKMGSEDASVISVYPNPTKDLVTIKGLTNGENITITNILGKDIMNISVKQNEEIISTAGFKSGMYFISVGEKTRLKLVKE